VSGQIVLLLLGGFLLALVEKTGYREGVWLAFSVISTTGFGDGPNTLGGQLLSMILFALAAIHWFAIVLGAFEIGFRRTRTHGLPANLARSLPDGGRWLSRER
jgi:hypothetical protein